MSSHKTNIQTPNNNINNSPAEQSVKSKASSTLVDTKIVIIAIILKLEGVVVLSNIRKISFMVNSPFSLQ